jgi:hypothetical protein
VFQHNPNGELVEFVLDLRSLTPISAQLLSPIKEEEDSDGADGSKTFEVKTKSDKNLRQQRDMIEAWVADEDHKVMEEDRHPLELYSTYRLRISVCSRAPASI